MSKKKAFGGNTMTLKDFHGGSIPTDLPLPSAPGVTVRSAEWGGYDRSNSWGGAMGRQDHRVRPNSSPATRHFDDRTPFLSNSSRIGRNFDEDERKPLDSVSGPRRTVSDENSVRAPPNRLEIRSESVSGGKGSQFASSYSARVSEGTRVGVSSQSVGGNSGQSVGASHPNPWAVRRDSTVVSNEPLQPVWSEVSAVSKLAHASAIEKVSSGRWQTKHSTEPRAEIEIIEHEETEKSVVSRGYDDFGYRRTVSAGGREYSDAKLARHVERGLSIEDGIQGGQKEFFNHDRARAPFNSEVKERNPSMYGERVLQPHNDGKFGLSEVQLPVQSEALECPKVNLLPRTKPLETPVIDHKQGYQRPSDATHGQVTNNELQGNVNVAKPSSANVDGENQVAERPKLHLKPRSQPLEQSEGNIEKERNALFGGARPREVVLKERGIDDSTVSNADLGEDSERIKHHSPKNEKVPDQAIPVRYGERTGNLHPEKAPDHAHAVRHGERIGNLHLDQKNVKRPGRKEQRVNVEKVDTQKRNWRNENWRNNRETDRQKQPQPQPQQQQQQQQQQERHPSPETWRKPVEPPKPASPDAAGLRYGKTASALELAQAFSKSLPDPKTTGRYPAQRVLPGKTQMPFSRLVGPTSTTQINGY